jgi:hypothetical protein
MVSRLTTWWESQPARRQAALAYPAIALFLLVVHVAFFHRITVGRSVVYAVGEALPITGLLVLASQQEAARKRIEAARDERPGGDDGVAH